MLFYGRAEALRVNSVLNTDKISLNPGPLITHLHVNSLIFWEAGGNCRQGEASFAGIAGGDSRSTQTTQRQPTIQKETAQDIIAPLGA